VGIASKGLPLLKDATDHLALGRRGEAQVDEAWPGNLGRFDERPGVTRTQRIDQGLSNGARVGLQGLGDLLRQIAGQIAMFGLTRAIEGHVERRQLDCLAGIARRLCEPLCGRLEGRGQARFVFG
jgi:hypothetical protein